MFNLSKKSIYISAGSIVVLIIILVGGIYAWRYKTQKKNINLNLVTEKLSTIETASWQKYSSEKYGFEVKYPAGFKVEEEKDSMVEGITLVGSPIDVNISYYDNLHTISYPPTVSLRNFWDLTKDPSLSNVKKVSFLGNDAFTAVFTNEIISCKCVKIYISHNGHIYEIIYDKPEDKESEEIVKDIISTFKFIK